MIKLAGCIIKDERGRVLLLHRNNNKHLQWEVPGGKIDEGENPEQAAVREINEELGVNVVIQEKIGQKEFIMGDKSYHYTWFLAKITTGQPKVTEPEVFDDLRYFSAQEMQDIHDQLSPNTQNYLSIIKG